MWYLSKELALACGGVTCVLWAVALRYGSFSRKAQRTYQDALANTNEASNQHSPSFLPEPQTETSRHRAIKLGTQWTLESDGWLQAQILLLASLLYLDTVASMPFHCAEVSLAL